MGSGQHSGSRARPEAPRHASKFIQSGSCADLVDAFGRVHVRESEDGKAGREMPTVLTKLKKWADYASVGEPVYPTKFLPMKTPMSNEIVSNWSLEHPPKHVLTIQSLIESQEREHGRKVGLIIDLANHDCLYIDDLLDYNREVDVSDIVEYVHVGLVAKELPPQEVIDQVEQAAREFWERKPDSYVCLHCCYGFNRTGYVLCSYLCQVCGMGVEESLASFARSRGPGVKHKKFVEALWERYGGEDMKVGGERGERGEERVTANLSGETPSHGEDKDGGSDKGPRAEGQKQGPIAVMLPAHKDHSDSGTNSVSDGAGSSTFTTPQGSRVKFRVASQPIGILTKSAPSSMRRDQSAAARKMLGESGEWSTGSSSEDVFGEELSRTMTGRSCNSTGGMLESGEDFDRLADTLKFNVAMRREVHLGLAKALHNDFGQHDFHPDESDSLARLSMEDLECDGPRAAKKRCAIM